jgi:SNF2 family DNA or RNA helicase
MVPARKRIVEVRESYDVDWDLIIVDESVLLKNRRAIKVDLIYQLAKYTDFVWLLSGSPTTRYNNDLFPQMKIIMPRGFKSYWRFAEYFCVVDKGQWGWKITGDQPDKPPAKYLKDFMFIRSQKDVLPELPDYIYDPIEIDLTAKQLRAFDEMMEDWVTILDNGKEVSASIALAQQVRAAQITSNLVNIGGERSSAKEDLLVDMIDNDEIRFPLLIWTWWVPTAESVHKRLTDLYSKDLEIDFVIGDMDAAIKDLVLTDYKRGEIDVLVLQMGVGKFGHTLTDTRTVYYHDRYFDADAYFQSLRRVRRIGLDHRPRLVVPRSLHSFDPVVELNLSGKLQSIAKLGNKDLREMLQSLGSSMLPWSMEYEQ